MSKSSQEYEAEIADLNSRVQALENELQGQAALGLSLTSLGATAATPGSVPTIQGLEEMFLVLNSELEVVHLNSRMASWLGRTGTDQVKGCRLADVDDSPLGERAIEGLARAAKTANQAVVLEREAEVDSEMVMYRLIITPTTRGTEVVVQDVTRLRRLETTFGTYVSAGVIDQMMARPEEDFWKADRVDITVVFGDLRGYTSMSESLEPEDTRHQINEFLTEMVKCVEMHEGTVIGYAGDEIMTVWGAPLECEDHTLRAVTCCMEMQESQDRLMEKWSSEGRPAPAMGVGLNSGLAVVGNIGTPKRAEYTALGHTINLAARLCSKAEGGEILLTRATYDAIHLQAKGSADRQIPRIRFKPKGEMEFKNVKEPGEVVAAGGDRKRPTQ